MFEVIQLFAVSGVTIGVFTEIIVPLFTQGVELAKTVL